MAIVTISRIQHRRGYYDALPQLSAAELGWAVDQRRLFIGNGPVSEGAPTVGNTEILTQFSDVLGVAESYTYKNSNSQNLSPTTGPSASAPTVRTLQNKLDDFVSVADFGAKGDGSTDDTAAINRAMYEVYCKELFTGSKKAIYFPAGQYIISDYLKIPPFATLIGEGPFNTIIQQTADVGDATAVFQTADSKQQVGGSLGTNGASLPSDIMISNMALSCNLDGIYIDKCKRITLDRVRIVGVESFPITENSVAAAQPSKAIVIKGTSVAPSEDINLIDCYLTQTNYGIWQDDVNQFFQNLVISSGTFYQMYEGIKIAVTNGSAKNVVVTTSMFDSIYSYAVHVNTVQNFASSFNYYRDVGNNYGGTPVTSIISFGTATNHSASLGDYFDRTASEDLTIATFVGNANTSFIKYGHSLGVGYLSIENGNQDTLTDNTTGGSTSLSMNLTRYPHAQITYHVKRGSASRSGTLNVAFDGSTGYFIDDDSTETADVGVTFDITISSGAGILTYTTTSTGSDATLHYSVKRLNNVV